MEEDSNIGRVLEGKYELKRVLGVGGMGAVYEANHRLIKRRLAVKLLHEEYAKQEWTMQRFKQEAIAATAIGHDHIVDITDMGVTDEGEIFIVMEYLDGIDLATLLKQEGSLPPQRACHIIIQVLSALEAAHAKGIIHRDLKPANIFLITYGGVEDYVKLVDFGISKVKQVETDDAHALTRTGELLGTPSYMSPEQAVGDVDITYHTDIFSVGVILYNLLTGELPFQAGALGHLLMKIINEAPKPVTEIRPHVPPALEAAVTKALQKKVPDRFGDAAEFRRCLIPFSPDTPTLTGLKSTRYGERVSDISGMLRERLSEPTGETTPVSMVHTVAKRKTKKRWPLLVGLGLGAAAVAGLAVVFFGRPESTRQPPSPVPVVQPAESKAPAESEGPSPKEKKPEPTSKGILFHVDATPKEATVFVDGFPVGAGNVKRRIMTDASSHEVMVVAEGYKEFKKKVTFDKPVNLTVVLGRSAAPERRQSAKSAAGKSRRPTSAEPPKKDEAPSPPPQEATAKADNKAEAKKPADTPAPAAPGFRPIDEEAPW